MTKAKMAAIAEMLLIVTVGGPIVAAMATVLILMCGVIIKAF